MNAVLVNYNYDPTWLVDYPELNPVIIYDRSDDGVERDLTKYGTVYKTENIGNVDYDKLGYLIENYEKLPEVFLWSKSNLSKFITKEEFDVVKDNTDFTPLLTMNHEIYTDNSMPNGGVNIVNAYDTQGMYYERFGIVNTLHQIMPWKHYKLWEDWCLKFNLPRAAMIPFPPGGSFILTRERVHRYAVDYYKEMRNTLDYAQLPLEAYFCERSYFLMFR